VGPGRSADLEDWARLAEVVIRHKPADMLFFAAFIEAGALACVAADALDKIAFSSTAAANGEPR